MDTFECPLCLENFHYSNGVRYSCFCITCLSCLEDTKIIIKERDGNYACIQCKQPYRKEAIPLPLTNTIISPFQQKWLENYSQWKSQWVNYSPITCFNNDISVPVVNQLKEYIKEKEMMYNTYKQSDLILIAFFLNFNTSELYLNELSHLFTTCFPPNIGNIKLKKVSHDNLWSDSYRIMLSDDPQQNYSSKLDNNIHVSFDNINWILTNKGLLQDYSSSKSEYHFKEDEQELNYYHKDKCLHTLEFESTSHFAYQEDDNVYVVNWVERGKHIYFSYITPYEFHTYNYSPYSHFTLCNKKLYMWYESSDSLINLYVRNERFEIIDQKIIYGSFGDNFTFFDDYYVIRSNYALEVFLYKDKN